MKHLSYLTAALFFNNFGSSSAVIWDLRQVFIRGGENDAEVERSRQLIENTLENAHCLVKHCFPRVTDLEEKKNFCAFIDETVRCAGRCAGDVIKNIRADEKTMACIDLSFLFGCDMRCQRYYDIFNEGLDERRNERVQEAKALYRDLAEEPEYLARQAEDTGTCSQTQDRGPSTVEKVRNEMMSGIWKSMLYLMSYTMPR